MCGCVWVWVAHTSKVKTKKLRFFRTYFCVVLLYTSGVSLLHSYIPLLQEKIKRDPSLVIEIRSTFLKLASIMEVPLIRVHARGTLA